MSDIPSSQDTAQQIDLILQSVDCLPTLSPVAARVLSIGSSDRADFNELTRLIEADPALTSKIIGLCRRAALGLGDRITTVKRALVMLGFEAVRAAVLSISVYELIADEAAERDAKLAESLGESSGGRAFDRVGFWMYSVGVASAAEQLAAGNRSLRVSPEEAFVAGLLHGLGKAVLDLLLPRAYGRVIELAERRRTDCAPIEREVFGIDHHGAARRIAERWGLPPAVRDVMWLYDHPVEALPEGISAELVRIVATARALCRELHVGVSGDHGSVLPSTIVADRAGLSRQSLDVTTRRLHEAVADRCRVLGLDEQAPPELLLRSITQANRSLASLSQELEERANEGARVGRVLGAIAEFWRAEPRDTTSCLRAMTLSGSKLLGNGRWAAALQREGRASWLVCLFESDGRLVKNISAAPPASLSPVVLASPRTWREQTGIPSALASWIGSEVGLDAGRAPLRLLGGTEGAGCPGCVLLTDAREPEQPVAERHLAPLRATWGAALSAAIHREATERLAESLADSNRALAAAQSRLTETESMARLGEMTAGAAHEMNNPLTVIRGRAQLLADSLSDARDRETASRIASAAADLSDLVTTLHGLARPGEPDTRPTRMETVVERAAYLAGGDGPRVCFEGPPEPVVAMVDAEMLARALGELVRNARDWAPDGIVRVRVQIEPPDDRLEIRVEDDGPGLSDKALRHAFDPFFSERPAGRRRGLGLSVARRLVEAHGGTVRLEPGEHGGVVAIVGLEGWRVAPKREAGLAA